MSEINASIPWEAVAQKKYQDMTTKIPLFHRDIAQQVVDKKAVLNAQDRGASQVEEEDIIRAFFSEVPMTFYSLMIRLMDEVGLDHDRFELKK